VNVVGISLVLWGTLWFSDWVRPSLTPEDLFDPPVVGPQAVKAAFVEQGIIERVATYTGTVHPYERITVYARSNGFVEGVEVYPGDHVRKGQVVAHLETSEIAPRLDHALAELTYLLAELKRDEELFRSGAVAASALDLSRSKERVAAAKVKLLQTEIGYATIAALSDGWVSERMVDPGQYVQRGQPLLSYDRLQKVRLRFDVAEQDLAMVQPGTEVVLEFPQIPRARFDDSSWKTRLLADYKNPAARAEVTTVFPMLGGQSRLGVVEVLMPNPGMVLRSNTYVVGHLVTGRMEDAWIVPQRALTPMPDGKTVIFLAPAFADQGEVEMREVVVGLRNGIEVEIVDGLDENAYVVVSGNRGLMDGENVMVIEREGGF
jgi:RND family efflux transporter MFP subunit